MKMIVQTTGEFLLQEPYNREVVENNRPHVVSRTTFFQERIALGQLTFLGDVPNDATDEEFAEFWQSAEGDEALAIDSFKSRFQNLEPTPAPKPRRRKA